MNEADAPEIGLGQLDAVLKFLPLLQGGCGEWAGRPGQVPVFLYSSWVNDFVLTLYQQGIIIAFDWTGWREQAKRYQADPGSLAQADLLTLLKLLTLHVRGDRFVEGHLASVLESGHVTAILERMQQIRDAMVGGESWAKRSAYDVF
jgi:hypothetical protein